MKAKNEIERWLKDEKFMAFANKRGKSTQSSPLNSQ